MLRLKWSEVRVKRQWGRSRTLKAWREWSQWAVAEKTRSERHTSNGSGQWAVGQWAVNIEHRTPNTERRTPNAEHRTPNIERRTSNAECVAA